MAEATHPITVRVAVSREPRNLGPYISYLQNDSNLPLSLNSFVVVVLVNESTKDIEDQYLAVRPPGLASDVVIYAASNMRRLVTVSLDQVNGASVKVEVQATYEDLIKFMEPDLVRQYKNMHESACQEMRAEFLGDVVSDPSQVNLEPVSAKPAPAVVEVEEEEEEEFDAFEDVGGGDGPLVADSPTDVADNQFSVEEEELEDDGLEEDDSVPFDIDDRDFDEEYHAGTSSVTVQEETATGDSVEEEEVEEDSVPFNIDDSDEEQEIFASDDSLVTGIYYLDEACTKTCDEDGNPIEVEEVEVEEEVVEEDEESPSQDEEEVVLFADDDSDESGIFYLDDTFTQPCDEDGNPVEVEEVEEEEVEVEVEQVEVDTTSDPDLLDTIKDLDLDALRLQAKSFGVNHRFANKCMSKETLINKIIEKANEG